MKIPAYIYMLGSQERLPARFVQLVRDPRGVAYSNTKAIARQGSRPDKPMRTMRTPGISARKWLWFHLSFELLSLRRPFVQVRYEDLVRDPADALRDCAAVLGRTLASADLRFVRESVVRLEPGHLIAGNRMRFTSGEVELRSDEAWREELPSDGRRTVERIAAPLLYRYGYERGTR